VEVPCDYEGEHVELAVNIQYFTQMVEHVDGKCVDIRFNNGRTLAVLPMQDFGYQYFLAQMKRD
jgi:DNA polymerase III sliding clamp (beta) subunit (PCNA family)